MKEYKIRMNCPAFEDVIVQAESEEEAIEKAQIEAQCSQPTMEFGDILEVKDI